MIDRKARDILAESYRHLITGQITNDEFEDRLKFSKDIAIHEIYYRGAWPLYDDLHEHKLTEADGYAIPEESKSVAARFILFLKTDLEYEWPRKSGIKAFVWALFGVFTLGVIAIIRKIIAATGEKGDKDVWPFYRRSDYEAALEAPPYLRGK
ncbi:hypothetical protein [Geobacter sp. SVR]|uniref:hypothetical protein n=1 Tax=Geobacter sp. SVR TaxID=2495594 RepID=UPI00143EF986|nr:hypothetical protein [Geobacter sp. SVR]BCS52267.1 hypothetical protein GSVR_05750 [Geobacter sp. SVR]GCF85072.1 hypothetical protein GSbR_16720 [Geobacter sp. SVR]